MCAFGARAGGVKCYDMTGFGILLSEAGAPGSQELSCGNKKDLMRVGKVVIPRASAYQ